MTDKEFDYHKYLDRIKRADHRSAIFAVINNFLDKIEAKDSQFSPSPGIAVFIRNSQTAFLDKLDPSLFGLITANEFKSLFSSVFLKSPFPADSLFTLINFTSSIRKEEHYKFAKVVQLFQLVQMDLLQRILTDNANSASFSFGSIFVDQFSFALSSFPDRVHNFTGRTSDQNAVDIINVFEQSLFSSLIKTLESAALENIKPNFELIAHILTDYNSVSTEFTDRFLSTILQKEVLHPLLPKIFTFCGTNKRRREKLIQTLVQLAPDGHTLEILLSDSALLDALLQKCLLSGKVLLSGQCGNVPSTSATSLRNSRKIATYMASLGQPTLLSSFWGLLQLFQDQCRFIELVTLNNQFQLALAIVDFASELSVELRTEIRDQLVDFIVPLVPQLLQQPDCSRRQIGMCLVEKLFALFDFPSPLNFKYTEEDLILQELRHSMGENNKQDKQTQSKENNEEMNEHKETTSNGWQEEKTSIDRRVTVLLDSDDDIVEDDELQGTSGTIVGIEPTKRKQFVYLRDCVEALRSEKENPRRWEAALEDMLALLSRKAVGWDLLSQELFETTLFLENRFRIAKFKEIQSKILKIVLAQKPELVSRCMRLIASMNCSMTHRFLLIMAIVQSARMLSGREADDEDFKSSCPKIHEVNSAPEKGDKANEKGPKITWRSKALDNKNLNSEFARKNQFFALAPQFAFPLLDFGQFFQIEIKDFVLLSRLIWALGEIITCATSSPSIVRIISASFSWLRMVRQHRHPFVLSSCVYCYLAIQDSIPANILLEQFTEELRDLWDWLSGIGMDIDKTEANDPLKQSSSLLLHKLSIIFSEKFSL